ncbi:hypothetical protein CDL12_07550 [Handroanthus impetiginosus]|uniref:BHLH domain-containing protein n=1 Tax=Handroanthus impetiginosus TaxID=429701 RepID=A0A2G9HR45_9LAMI|nr:hypothetical protein CDL12_07550 [Handroanthus impetiginosus]
MCSEEADFRAQLLGSCSLPNEVPSSSNFTVSSTFLPSHTPNMNGGGVGESAMYSSDKTNTTMYSFSQGSSYSGSSSIIFPSSSPETSYPSFSHQIIAAHNNFMTMDYCMMGGKSNGSQVPLLTNNVMEGDDFLNQDVCNDSLESDRKLPDDFLQGKNFQFRKEHETVVPEPLGDDKTSSPSEISKKRKYPPVEACKESFFFRHLCFMAFYLFPRSKRSMKLKKCAKVYDKDEDNNNNNNNKNTVAELKWLLLKGNGAVNLNGKTRPGRDSATDPHSLCAKKRRERINERLRILQNLVPNGTKVDISTMLEEAVHSDDLWMYAPIAYNGTDIGLDLRISTPKSQS